MAQNDVDRGDTRTGWAALLARLTSGFVRSIPDGGSPAWPRLAGADPTNRITGMEGFCRMSVAWSAWLADPLNPATLAHGHQSVDVLDLVTRGLADGTDPTGPWYWTDIHDRSQHIVEAAEIAVALWTGRSRIVAALGPHRLRQVLSWLNQVHGRDVYADNWVLFPAIVATVSRGLGEQVEDRLIDEGIDRMLGWYAGDGWYSDGDGHAFDRYTGWAIHWYLLCWSRIDGDRRPEIRDLVVARAWTWLADLQAFAAADGAFPLFGRSLGYRFATAAPLGLAATLGLLPVAPGQARGMIDRSIRYHLEHDAIDPATDWFRVGVWGQRPDVCERYMSSGASAWAVRALVPLQLGADHPFWTATDPGLAQAGDHAGELPELVLRSPGYLVGRDVRTGATWVASGLMDHPDDIPGHDYRPSYGKWLYHTAFPFTNAAADGQPGPDGTMVLEGADGGIGHRGLVDGGGAGPSWIWSRHGIAVDGARHDLSVVSVRAGDVWVRAIGLRPTASVRASAATLPLAVPDAALVSRLSHPGTDTEVATDGTRWVGIRALTGYDRVLPSGPARGGRDRNLVAEHSEQPSVAESIASGTARLLAHVDVARPFGDDPTSDLAAFAVRAPDMDTLIVRMPDGEACVLSVGASTRAVVEIDGWTVTGPDLRVLRIGPSGAWVAGESIDTIVRDARDVVRMLRPGPVEVRWLLDGSVLVGTTEGLVIGGDRAPTAGARLRVLEAGGWAEAGSLSTAGMVPAGLIGQLRERTGHSLVWLRMDAP